MKNLILFVFSLAAFIFNCNAQWELQNPLPVANNLSDVRFYNDQIGWSVGSYGAIVITTDGGITWNVQESGVSESLKKVYIIDENTVWVSGSNGCLLYTDDAGNTWIQKTCETSLELVDITFLNGSTGWVVGCEDYNSWYYGNFEFVIKYTQDGGDTWITQLYDTTFSLRAIHFLNENVGWAVGEKRDSMPGTDGILIKTIDGGVNWEYHLDTNFLSLGSGFRDITFTEPKNGWILGGGCIFHSSDGGNTWQIQYMDPLGAAYYHFSKISFADSLNGLIAGSVNAGSAGSAPIVFKTINGGNFWEEQAFWLPFSSFSGSWMISPDTSFVVGSLGRIAKTTDGGATWDFYCETTTFLSFNDVHFIDSLHGWVIGYSPPPSCYASCARTIDGGVNWEFLFNNIQWVINGVCFTDENTGWIAGVGYIPERGILYYTTDGGYSWTVQYTDIGHRFFDVHFVDNLCGWTVGESGRVLHSSDAGINWDFQSTNTNEDLYKVFFLDRNHGWSVGRNGIVLGTNDGGITWDQQVSGTNQYLYDIHFFDQYNGFTVGDSGTILHTINGGNTWQLNNSSTQNKLCGIATTSADNAWAVGNGEILYTINGGITWEQQPSPINISIFSGLYFTDENKGWAVGYPGTIINIDNGTMVNLKEPNNSGKYSMTTIHYPNPFSNQLTIKYYLEKPSKVILTIFSSQGKQIDEVVIEQSQGSNALKWNARNCQSGIYYYRVETNNKVGSGKIILID